MSNSKSTLDEKIEEIISEADHEFGTITVTTAIEQVKQAFIDDGWLDTNQLGGLKSTSFKDAKGNWVEFMTGEQWYERFKMEMTTVPHLWGKDSIPHALTPYGIQIYEAARRASKLK